MCSILTDYGTAEQKARFLKPLARGEILASACLTEPGGGTDLGSAITVSSMSQLQSAASGSGSAIILVQPGIYAAAVITAGP